MTVQEVIDKLKGLDPDAEVLVRDTAISNAAMEAGSNGYAELDEILVVANQPHLLIGAF